MRSDPNCLFCSIILRKLPSTIIYEDDLSLAFEDVNPQAPVHILIVPKNHLQDINSIEEIDKATIGHLFLVAKNIASHKKLHSKGYRLVINNGSGAGQSIFHVHLHLLAGRRFSWPPG